MKAKMKDCKKQVMKLKIDAMELGSTYFTV